jgi:replicative DNA helicase
MLGQVVWPDCSAILKPEHFPRSEDRLIYLACQECAAQGDFSELTVRAHLGPKAPLGRIEELCGMVPNSTLVAEHAKRVREIAIAQELGTVLAKLRSELASDPSNALDAAESRVSAVCQGRLSEANGVPIADVISEAYREMEERANSPEVTGIQSGIHTLDKILEAGMCSNDLIVLAGRPGLGKTALSLQIARNAARSCRVFIVNLEMSRAQLGLRMMSSESGVGFGALRAGNVPTGSESGLAEACERLSSTGIIIEDRKRLTVADVRLAARMRSQEAGGLGLVVVDYLQLLQPQDRRQPREQQVAEMSRELKILAGELECPVLLLAQLNREAEKQQRAPRLSDLRESGSIEQDADIVMFVHQEQNEDVAAQIVVAKQRNGRQGVADVAWLGHVQRFDRIEQRFG